MEEKPADLDLFGLRIWVHGRQFPAAADYWDGNWLRVRATMTAKGAVVTAAGAFLRSDEIARFLAEIEILARDLKGRAELACMEPNLYVDIKASGGLSLLTGWVEITPDPSQQSHRFAIAGDQSYLPAIIAGCARVLAQHPVIGSP